MCRAVVLHSVRFMLNAGNPGWDEAKVTLRHSKGGWQLRWQHITSHDELSAWGRSVPSLPIGGQLRFRFRLHAIDLLHWAAQFMVALLEVLLGVQLTRTRSAGRLVAPVESVASPYIDRLSSPHLHAHGVCVCV